MKSKNQILKESNRLQMLENKIRKMVREELNEEEPNTTGKLDRGEFWTVYHYQGGNGWAIGKYVSEKIAKDVAAFLTRMLPYTKGSAQAGDRGMRGDVSNRNKSKYVVKKGY